MEYTQEEIDKANAELSDLILEQKQFIDKLKKQIANKTISRNIKMLKARKKSRAAKKARKKNRTNK